jgi:methyl-accepting chemotaxis protein
MRFSKWTLAKQLWFLSGLFMANILFVGLIEMRNSHEMVNQLKIIADKQFPAIHNMTLADMIHEGLEAVTYHAIIASEKRDYETVKKLKDEYKTASDNGIQYLNNIYDLKLNEGQVKMVQEVMPKFKEYIAAGEQIVNLVAANDRPKALTLMEDYHKKFEMMEGEFGRLGSLIEKESQESRNLALGQAAKSEFWNSFLVGLSLLIGFTIAFFLIRNMVKNFQKIIGHLSSEVSQLGTTSTQVNVTSQRLAEAATEQSASIEETVSSMEEITSMLDQTSHHSTKTLQIADDSQKVATEGRTTISRLTHAMDEIEDSNAKLERIVGLIEDIRQKTKVINDIVFETRLLSFNASIEAARAGIHGKGFAVVAEEVGKLASMSGKSAEEIRTLLDSSTKEVVEVVAGTRDRVRVGKQVSNECESAFNSMRDTLISISESVKTIASATKEQHVGIKQTNQAMQEMETVTQSNSQTAESLSEHAGSLDVAARNLKKTIDLLKHLVMGEDAEIVFDVDTENKSKVARASKSINHRKTTDVQEDAASSVEVEDNLEDAESKSNIVKPDSVGRGDSRWKSA